MFVYSIWVRKENNVCCGVDRSSEGRGFNAQFMYAVKHFTTMGWWAKEVVNI